jgi:nucleoside-diphosphate-sugar epimerase
VAGGAGFIGSYLCQSLLLQGCRVLALDNLITGKEENLKDCLSNPDFKFLKHNLTRPLKEIERVDYIFHLAGMEGNKKFPLKYLLVNSQGTKNLLEFAKSNGSKFLLGSSLGVFSPSVITKSLKSLYPKGSSLTSHHEARRFAEELTLEYFNQGVDARIVRLGWVYGPRMNLGSDREMTEVFRSALTTAFINIPGSGDQEIFPTFISDVIYGLTKAMFATQTSGEVFALIDQQKMTFFDLAQIIKKIANRDLKIKFVPEREEKGELDHLIQTSQKLLGWKARIGAEEGVKRTLEFFSKEKIKAAPEREVIPELRPSPVTKKSRRMVFAFLGILSLMTLILLPFLSPFFHSFLGAQGLKSSYQNLKLGEIDACKKEARASFLNFEKANRQIGQLREIFALLGLAEKNEQFFETTRLAKKVAKIAILSCDLAKRSEELNQIVFKSKPADLFYLSQETRVLLRTTWEELSFLETELGKKSLNFWLSKFLGLPETEEIKKNFSQSRRMIDDLSSVLTVLPQLVGAEKKKTYLVLLQNNMELRPTGGFIGSFVLISFKNGHLGEFEVFDVYSADGQLKGHIEPPQPLKEHLGEAGWYLRDSNWDPDFPTSAIKAGWFLEKTISRQVDGVIAINLNVVQGILRALGEVEVTDFDEKINADNLFQKAEYHAETGFFPGSTQKKDFLGNLTRVLLERMKTASALEQLKLGQAVYNSLEGKDLMVYLNEADLEKTISALSWEGSLRQINCLDPATLCLGDYLMLVEANLGVNKANFYLKRNLATQVKIGPEGEIEESLKIDYLNGSPLQARSGGVYKNYLRIYVPLGSALTQVKVNGVVLAEEKIELGIASGKTYFGFLVEVPASEKQTVEVTYQPPFKVKKGEEIDYLFFWQRQSGSYPSRLSLKIDLPQGASILKTNPVPKSVGREVEFEAELNKDLLFQTKIKL